MARIKKYNIMPIQGTVDRPFATFLPPQLQQNKKKRTKIA
jgi:hypothetical protein